MKHILKQIPYCHVLGEAKDGEEAIKYYKELSPDVIYMDVEMPIMNGINAASKIRELDQTVYIIFGTNFGDYVFDAIHHYAYDYMLKPFDGNRIKQTLHRILEIKNNDYQSSRLCMKCDKSTYFVPLDDIYMLEKTGKKLSIYTKYRTYENGDNLQDVEDKLNHREDFIRTHRSYIVNVNKISGIRKRMGTFEIDFIDMQIKALLARDRYKFIEKYVKI